MLYFKNPEQALPVFKALSSEVRLKILNIISENEGKNLNEIAQMLSLTNSAISTHINKLLEADLIEIHSVSGTRGSMKICKPKHNNLIVELQPSITQENCYHQDIRIGHYTACQVKPTCGLATVNGLIGEFDDPRYFYFAQRFEASVLWFSSGYIEYNIPNDLKAGERLVELQLSFEISSDAPGFQDVYPSDIYFSVNDVPLGYWVSPGDYGSKRGRFNPSWYPDGNNQYGLLKMLIVNKNGTFIDGSTKISDTTIDDLHIDYSHPITLRFSNPEDTRNPGGFTIFGAGFGNHNQSIKAKLLYE